LAAITGKTFSFHVYLSNMEGGTQAWQEEQTSLTVLSTESACFLASSSISDVAVVFLPPQAAMANNTKGRILNIFL
jgi:hypothetical protein